MPKFWNSKTLLAKIETTYGVDPTPTGAANAILATNVSFSPMEGTDVPRNLERQWFAADPTIAAGLYATISFSVEMVGSGTLGTAPGWGPLMRACAAAEVLTLTHALWTGSVVNVRYLRLSLVQPSGSAVLSAGVVQVGRAWRPQFNMEFGSGRRVIDTGTVAVLPDGGFSTMEGARKREFNLTLGDLSRTETDALEELLLDHGETVPLVLVEDPDATTGQRARIHYGLFVGLKAFERKNAAQTTWQLTFEEWI